MRRLQHVSISSQIWDIPTAVEDTEACSKARMQVLSTKVILAHLGLGLEVNASKQIAHHCHNRA